MKKRTKVLIACVIGLQLYCIPQMVAEQVNGLANAETGQGQAAVLVDSLQNQEPPGMSPACDTVMATYYSRCFNGRRTANGERYDRNVLTCAHKTLPFNTLVKVTNPTTNQSVVVRVNDRGPFRKNRKLDLSYAAAKEIGMVEAGVMKVIMEVLPPDPLTPDIATTN